MLENDNWIGLGSSESIVDELYRELQISSKVISRAQFATYADNAKKIRAFLQAESHEQNPFHIGAEKGTFLLYQNPEAKVENKQTYDESDEDEEDEDEEDDPTSPKKAKQQPKDVTTTETGPVITSVAYNLAKKFDVYLRAMEVLKPIADESFNPFVSFTALYKFYVRNYSLL